eukprot:5332936-Amphidinium_carterae.2
MCLFCQGCGDANQQKENDELTKFGVASRGGSNIGEGFSLAATSRDVLPLRDCLTPDILQFGTSPVISHKT